MHIAVASLVDAYRLLNDPDAEEIAACCRRMAVLIASIDGADAAAEWFNRQVRLALEQAGN